MKIFVSYPHSDAELAENLAMRLMAEDHQVFWDRSSLPAGESFDDRIRDGIQDSDLFICLVSKDSLDDGKYARTELKFAQQKWPNPSGAVLPVALDDEAIQSLPAYLKSVTIKRPQGDPVAEILDDVHKIEQRPIRKIWKGARAIAVIIAAIVICWLVYRGLPQETVKLTVGMSGKLYKESVSDNSQTLLPSTEYFKKLDQAIKDKEAIDGEQLLSLINNDDGEVSAAYSPPLPIIGFRITNNSEQTIIVDRLRLNIQQSQVDHRPLLWSSARADYGGVINAAFKLGNYGWGPVQNVEYHFDLVAESALQQAAHNNQRKFSKQITKIDSGEVKQLELWSELALLGADVDFLNQGHYEFDVQQAEQKFSDEIVKLKSKIGAQPDEDIFTIGELTYHQHDGKQAKLLFRQQIHIVYPTGIALPYVMIPTADYEVELKEQGKDYSVERSVAHSLMPGEAEAINLRVWAEKSSFHEMTASIRVGEQWIQASDRLRLEYYRPTHVQGVKGEQL